MDDDGLAAREIFGRKEGYTYDDLILLPGHIDFATTEVQLQSRFSRNINVKIPLVSSPMDTVTEHKMAISMALHGGLGVIHSNLSVEDQAHEVFKKKFLFSIFFFVATLHFCFLCPIFPPSQQKTQQHNEISQLCFCNSTRFFFKQTAYYNDNITL